MTPRFWTLLFLGLSFASGCTDAEKSAKGSSISNATPATAWTGWTFRSQWRIPRCRSFSAVKRTTSAPTESS